MTKYGNLLYGTVILLLLTTIRLQAKSMSQDTLPFYNIPDYPSTYSGAHVLARSIDGLGFRYHWATEGLTVPDYNYNAGNGSRSVDETMDHLYSLSEMIKNAVLGIPNVRPSVTTAMTRTERREATLANLKAASDRLHSYGEEALADMVIIFQRGEKKSEVPFWHLLNGPLADAMWHCGQIVAHRRAAGNPMPSGVNVFMGTKQ